VRSPVLETIRGQTDVVSLLEASLGHPLHAYLFLGPRGTGREEAAVAFAAALFCPDGGCGECDVCRAVLANRHPDLVLVEREGAAIRVQQAAEVVRLASRTPRLAPYQVLVLVDFDLLGEAGPVLLKTIEEPPDTTIIVVTAESVPADFVTIASRCAEVRFRPLGEAEITAALREEGCDEEFAAVVARTAGGRLDRARLLRDDPGHMARIERWRELPSLIDGTGASAVKLASQLLGAADEPVEVVRRRQADELEMLKESAEAAGERSVRGVAEIEARFRREQRRVRTDELRSGLSALADVYRRRLERSLSSEPADRSSRSAVAAIELIDEAASRLVLNVNESLLLQWLLLRLGDVA
jgi:DNA polymerase-3 subunit delta'